MIDFHAHLGTAETSCDHNTDILSTFSLLTCAYLCNYPLCPPLSGSSPVCVPGFWFLLPRVVFLFVSSFSFVSWLSPVLLSSPCRYIFGFIGFGLFSFLLHEQKKTTKKPRCICTVSVSLQCLGRQYAATLRLEPDQYYRRAGQLHKELKVAIKLCKAEEGCRMRR